jgi:hypothetical protein
MVLVIRMPEPFYGMARQSKKIKVEQCAYIFRPLCIIYSATINFSLNIIHRLAPRDRVLLDRCSGNQRGSPSPFYETWRFFILYANACQWLTFWTTRIQFTSSHHFALWYISVFSSIYICVIQVIFFQISGPKIYICFSSLLKFVLHEQLIFFLV